MYAARLHAYRDALRLDEVDDPKVTGPFDVIVRIGAAGLCRTDLHIQEGQWAGAIIDFVGENGAIEDGIAMIRDGGFYYVIGYGENINIPTIDVISREISFIGNLVGTYSDLQELMTLTAQGRVSLRTSTYPLDAINQAMADLDNGRLQGRGILVPREA